jgi:hypothetical protein
MSRHLALIALLGFLVSVNATGAVQLDSKPDWSVDPLTLRQPMTDEKTVSVWIGMRNERRAPQRTCVQSEGYIIGSMTDPHVSATTVTHACSEDSHFTIVLPGETFFYGMTVDLRKDWRTGPLELSLFIFDFDDSGVRRTSELKWKGKVSSLVEAGRRIISKNQQR